MNGTYRRFVEIALAGTAVGLFVVLFLLFDKFWTLFASPVGGGFWQSPSFWVGLLISAALWIGVRRSEKAMVFLDEVLLEMSKVIWPQRSETVKLTGVILVLIAIASLILFVFDGIWGTGMGKFLGKEWF